ncbi:deoxyribose-phosphate aldolase [Proteiniclasticum ruminis]|jgi:deoxyribose-phosphate aldolase|uniref:deoxyribose-phosphate aldolase n=1 Tax=Proteiniclasticum ruminis TaxID=398199 RepID=UPI001B6FD739|nr:deoxyribose-phosphate aldolase [Proteiniclasticum ruminis]MBP9920329.1 deoxyribose-phosphate aldolase [Proteiniclasticum sp.]
MDKLTLAKHIDHTLLKPDGTEAELIKLCEEAKEYKFFSVCVNPCNIEKAKELLKDSDTKICTVVGFPLGQMTTEAKSFETKEAVFLGAEEVDMVINIGKLKDGDYDYVLEDIRAVVLAAGGVLTKVIIESCLLTDEEKVKACELAKAAGADYVKTSTGFSKSGATKEDIALMRKTVGPEMGVKASGGIRTLEDALAMIENGASRLGLSASVSIVNSL